jgi:AcrR family transcriptional regulator
MEAARTQEQSLKARHAAATKAAIVKSARALFARRGYANVGVEDIAQRARVTRGALYHHFRDKAALFAFVCEEVEREVAENVAAAVDLEGDPEQEFLRGLSAFLDHAMKREMQQIVVSDGPAVLGWRARHEIAERYGLAMIEAGLQRLVDAGRLKKQPLGALARLILGALTEAIMVIAEAEDKKRARQELERGLEQMVVGLLDPAS